MDVTALFFLYYLNFIAICTKASIKSSNNSNRKKKGTYCILFLFRIAEGPSVSHNVDNLTSVFLATYGECHFLCIRQMNIRGKLMVITIIFYYSFFLRSEKKL